MYKKILFYSLGTVLILVLGWIVLLSFFSHGPEAKKVETDTSQPGAVAFSCASPWNPVWATPEDTKVLPTQAVYYVSKIDGNDNNSGRLPESAWRTTSKVNGTTFAPGDVVLFKRGDTWDEKLNPISSGTKENPILFGAYGGGGARPVFRSEEGLLVYHQSHLIFNNLDFRGEKNGAVIWEEGDFITLDHVTVGLDAQSVGILINGGSDNGVIQYSVLDGGTETVSQRDMIRFLDGSNWEIHHNLVANFGHTGIDLLAHIPRWNDADAHVLGTRVHHNEIYTRLDYGHAFSTQGDGPGYASGNKIYENFIHDVKVSSHVQGDHNEVYNNIFYGIRKSPQTSESDIQQASAIDTSDYIYSADNIIRNNIIINTDGPGIWVSSTESGNVVKDNIIFNPGLYRGSHKSLYNVGLYITERGFQNQEVVGAQTYRNNLIYSPESDKTVIYRELHYENPTPINVAEFNNRNGKNGDVIEGNKGQKFLLTADCKIVSSGN